MSIEQENEDKKKREAQKQSILKMLAEEKKKDPLAAVKFGAQEITARLYGAFRDRQGVNVNAVLTVLAAMAGFSCQMGVREELVKTGKVPLEKAMMRIDTKKRQIFYAGGFINKPLVEDEYSIWSLVAGAVQHMGKPLPPLEAFAEHSAKTLGTKEFGVARVPAVYRVEERPEEFLKDIWPVMVPIMDEFCDHALQRPILLGIAISGVMQEAKDMIDPTIAATLVMDIAVAMAKIDPETLKKTDED